MGYYGLRSYRNRRYPPRRGRFHRRWWWRRFYPKRHRYYRRHSKVIRQHFYNAKYIYVRGWEPLGINGSYIEGQNKATHLTNNNWKCEALKGLDCKTERTNTSYVDLVGGWGKASFSIQGLLQRATMGLCDFSEDITQYTSARFVSITIWGVPVPDLDWVLFGQTHFTYDKQELKNLEHYANPIRLMMKKGRLFCPSLKRSQKRLFWRRKFKAGTQFTNEFYDKGFFYNKPFWTYIWSYLDLVLPSGVPNDDNFMKQVLVNANFKNEWYKEKDCAWTNRKQYQTQKPVDGGLWNAWSAFISSGSISEFAKKVFGNNVKHAPGAPPILPAFQLQQGSFFYNVKLQASGRSIAGLQGGSAAEIPPPGCKCPDSAQTGTQCSACLRSGEVGVNGTVSPETFRRIVGAHNQDQLSFTSISEEEETPGSTSSEEEEEQLDAPQHTIVRRLVEFLQNRDPQ